MMKLEVESSRQTLSQQRQSNHLPKVDCNKAHLDKVALSKDCLKSTTQVKNTTPKQ